MHACEGEMVCESINPKIPYFNAPIYLENKVHRFGQSINNNFLAMELTIIAIDAHWQGRRGSWPHQPGVLHHQAPGGHCRNFIQAW